MNISKKGQKLLTLGLFVFVLCATAGGANAAPVTGAIFTTDMNSNYVNANVYDNIGDVYLNGGPRPNAPCTAAGLPDGYYVFQVTDPSGATLLSTDPIANRLVRIAGGLIVEYLGPKPNEAGAHLTGFGKCIATNSNNITVALSPFNPTPNPGGEYKVWMTKATDYIACGYNDDPTQYDPATSDPRVCSGSFGFIPSKSKTDNFKVIPPAVGGDCPGDQDCDGIPDDAELSGTFQSEAKYCFPPTDPTKSDTDGDGFSDIDEVTVWGTDPTVKDPDMNNDGVPDTAGMYDFHC
jgi:hypothetical protein